MINSGRAAAGPWANHRQATSPVSWNHENKRFDVMLSGFTMKEASPDDRIEVTFAPPVLYVHSIRKAGDSSPSPGLVSPIPSVAFVGLEPGQEYEVTTHAMDPATEQQLSGSKPAKYTIYGPKEDAS